MPSSSPYSERLARVRAGMIDHGVDVLLLSVGPDLPWLIGYEAMPLERLTMLVLPVDTGATLVVPRLEAPRVVERSDLFSLQTWDETGDPIAMVAALAGGARTAAIGDRTWARFMVDLQTRMPGVVLRRAGEITGPLRARKDTAEVAALRRAGEAADRVAAELQSGGIALAGRTEAAVSADVGRRLLDEGHSRVNFAIVAAGPNAASPHHEPAGHVICPGEVVLCDFGGTMHADGGAGYCSDITRCVHVGEPSAEFSELYAVLRSAQAAAVAAATIGTQCQDVDAAARRVIADAGHGEHFLHRTGHGIGIEEHEDPYIVEGNATALAAGHAFSVEPGIYVRGRWGARLEDIVVATDQGPDLLNKADHGLLVVDG